MRHAGGQSPSTSNSRACCSSKKCVRVRRPRQKPVSLPTLHATTTPHAFRQVAIQSSSSLAVACVAFISRPHPPRLTARQVGTRASNTMRTRRVWRIPASQGRLLARAQADERDVVLLENGLMLERVDLRHQSSACGRARSVSLDKRAGADDRMPTYSTPMPVMPYRYPSPPIPESASTRGGRTTPRAQSQNAERRSLFGGLRASIFSMFVVVGWVL